MRLTALLLLENMGVVGDQGYLPFYWAIKPSLLVFLWGFEGAELIFPFLGGKK